MFYCHTLKRTWISFYLIPFSLLWLENFSDFWTTKCTRCPEALDKLDRMAQDPQYTNVQIVSICCDKLDGAREIIEKDDGRRWQHISHYFMEPEDKEAAKKILGFKAVPFYVVLNEEGEIYQMGDSKAVDFDRVPGKLTLEENKENLKPEDFLISSPKSVADRAFILDELDF